MNLKYAIAITGGIGSGKSTIASLLRLYGYYVICADAIAHNVLNAKTQEVLAAFGEEVLTDAKGAIDRKKLGAIVFNDKEKRALLEDILQPAIREDILHKAQLQERKGVPYFVEIPLFFERGDYPIAHSLLIATTQELQIARLKQRDGFNKEEALQRMQAQMPLEEKRTKASFVIENCGTLESLQEQLEHFLKVYLPSL